MNDIDINDIYDMLGLDKSKYNRRFAKDVKYKSYIAFILTYIFDFTTIKVGEIMNMHHSTVIYHRDRILDLYEINTKYGLYEKEMIEIENLVKVFESYIEFQNELSEFETSKKLEIKKKFGVLNEL